MNALVVGCGAIGRRHINNLMQIKNINSIVVCTKHAGNLKEDNKKIAIIDSLDHPLVTALNPQSIDFAIISNETHKHIDTANYLAEKGIHLFIEKPLSHSLEKTNRLREIIQRKKIILFVAYNLRFLGAINYIKEQLSLKTIGDLYFAQIEAGQDLSSWRPNRDYRECYSARAKNGGGVAMDLSHEIDYMCYLFGNPCLWKVIKTKVSGLEIDSDDICEGIYKYESGFVCHLHMDYLQIPKKRTIRVVGSKGKLDCDLVNRKIRIMGNDGLEVKIDDADMFDIDKTYRDELNYFIQLLQTNTESLISLDESIQVLRMMEDCDV